MKKSLVLAMAMAMGISATAFAANPFSDVPAGHWAYASVAKLAAAGIVDGYPDGTFKGDNLMTRYEMAQIVAKAYAKGAIGADDKLMAEFADELDNLGVRVAKLEKKADKDRQRDGPKLSYFFKRDNLGPSLCYCVAILPFHSVTVLPFYHSTLLRPFLFAEYNFSSASFSKSSTLLFSVVFILQMPKLAVKLRILSS